MFNDWPETEQMRHSFAVRHVQFWEFWRDRRSCLPTVLKLCKRAANTSLQRRKLALPYTHPAYKTLTTTVRPSQCQQSTITEHSKYSRFNSTNSKSILKCGLLTLSSPSYKRSDAPRSKVGSSNDSYWYQRELHWDSLCDSQRLNHWAKTAPCSTAN